MGGGGSRYAGKVALVTGAAGGIGRATAERLARDEVAALIAFLGSDEARYINGSIYTIDGGMTPI